MEIAPPRVNPWSDERLNAAADGIRREGAAKNAAKKAEIDAAIKALLRLSGPPDGLPALPATGDRHYRAMNAGIAIARHYGERDGAAAAPKALSLLLDSLAAMIGMQSKPGCAEIVIESMCQDLRRRASQTAAVAERIKEARS